MLWRVLVFFNKRLSEKHNWSPSWFFASGHDKKLITNIRKFQKKRGLFPSGLCGKKTKKEYIKTLLKTLLDIKRRKH